MKDSVTIKLTEEQRFLIESIDNEGLMLIDEIEIMPHDRKLILTGRYFDVKYGEMDIAGSRPMHMDMSITENATWSDDDE